MADQYLKSNESNAILSTKAKIHIIEHSEAFEEFEGRFGFSHSQVAYKLDGEIYLARTELRLADRAKITAEDLTEPVVIPIEAYAPLFTLTLTALDFTPSDRFIKHPRFTSYDPDSPHEIADAILAETKTCEVLKEHPHPNVAQYLGCQVQNGRITGLCFHKYKQTLMGRVNPGHHGKRAFTGSGWNLEECNRYLSGIESGLKHLHSLGLVHNDVNPANIMFDDDDNPILIDFGSCVPIGQSLERVGRTYEWYDEAVQTSQPENDLDAVAEIREWLNNKPDKKFKFEE